MIAYKGTDPNSTANKRPLFLPLQLSETNIYGAVQSIYWMYGYYFKNALMQNTSSSIFWTQTEFQEEKSVRVEGERHKNRLKKDGLSVKKFVTVTAYPVTIT